MPGTAPLLQPVEDAIRKDLVPALLGRAAPGDLERAMLALPTRLGGLNLINPTNLTDSHGHSPELAAPLIKLIKEQSFDLETAPADQVSARQRIHQERRLKHLAAANDLSLQLQGELQRSHALASEHGGSTLLSALPLSSHGFHLPKSTFRDGLHRRYGWTPSSLPS